MTNGTMETIPGAIATEPDWIPICQHHFIFYRYDIRIPR